MPVPPQRNSSCRAYNPDGTTCGKPAGAFDETRGIPVCEEHAVPVPYRLIEKVFLGAAVEPQVKRYCKLECGSVSLEWKRTRGYFLRRYSDWTGERFEIITELGSDDTRVPVFRKLSKEIYEQFKSAAADALLVADWVSEHGTAASEPAAAPVANDG